VRRIWVLGAALGAFAFVNVAPASASCTGYAYGTSMVNSTTVAYAGALGCNAGDYGVVYLDLQRWNGSSWVVVAAQEYYDVYLNGNYSTSARCSAVGGHGTYRSAVDWSNWLTGGSGFVAGGGAVRC
jgi:hypothetical protein